MYCVFLLLVSSYIKFVFHISLGESIVQVLTWTVQFFVQLLCDAVSFSIVQVCLQLFSISIQCSEIRPHSNTSVLFFL